MRRLKPLHTRAHNLQLAVSSRQVEEQRALLTHVTEALALQREATSLTQRLGDERAVELAKQLETVRRQWGWVFWEGGWRGAASRVPMKGLSVDRLSHGRVSVHSPKPPGPTSPTILPAHHPIGAAGFRRVGAQAAAGGAGAGGRGPHQAPACGAERHLLRRPRQG